jgi:hypothetical protein
MVRRERVQGPQRDCRRDEESGIGHVVVAWEESLRKQAMRRVEGKGRERQESRKQTAVRT